MPLSKQHHPFILHLTLPADVPAAAVQQLANTILSAAPGCKATVDIGGCNLAIAEQLKEQHPAIELTHTCTTEDEINQYRDFYQTEVQRKAAESLAQFRQASHEQATHLRQLTDLLQRLPPEALSLIESELRQLFARLLTSEPPQA